jgi:predicted dehydrogenase
MSRKIKWGIVGAGYICNNFANGLKQVPDAEIVAVGSSPLDQANEFAGRWSIPKVYDSVAALVKDPEIDICYIGTPHSFHKEHAIQCLNAGKGVFNEKPFAINEKQAKEIVAVAREKKVFLMEAMWTQFFPAMIKARELVAQGVLGELRMMEADFGFCCTPEQKPRLYDPSLGGGALLDVGIYAVALGQLMTRTEPEKVVALCDFGKSGVDEQMGMILRYPGGALMTSHSAVKTNTNMEAWIYGTKGMLKICKPYWCPTKLVLSLEGKPDEEFSFAAPESGYSYEVVEVCKCLNEGKLEHPLITHELSLAVMRTMDRIRAAMGVKYEMDR